MAVSRTRDKLMEMAFPVNSDENSVKYIHFNALVSHNLYLQYIYIYILSSLLRALAFYCISSASSCSKEKQVKDIVPREMRALYAPIVAFPWSRLNTAIIFARAITSKPELVEIYRSLRVLKIKRNALSHARSDGGSPTTITSPRDSRWRATRKDLA